MTADGERVGENSHSEQQEDKREMARKLDAIPLQTTSSNDIWKAANGRWQMADGKFLGHLELVLAKISHGICSKNSSSNSKVYSKVWTYTDLATLVEIEFVWKSRIRLASVLYIITRYSHLLKYIFAATINLNLADVPLECVVPLQPSGHLMVYSTPRLFWEL
ncbi:hypothetical protein BU17DRAFT_62642 [Hysterangium stoloniferum]|nr:hypothetical protein BU17DRAFT_62642 [Hysterangium stoloniferum]